MFNYDDPFFDELSELDDWGEDEKEMPLGPCCICGELESVRNLIMLDHPGPTPGKGWGCFTCGLPQNGAIAVLCDPCLKLYQTSKQPLAYICTGYPAVDGRTPIDQMNQEEFEHDLSQHPEHWSNFTGPMFQDTEYPQ